MMATGNVLTIVGGHKITFRICITRQLCQVENSHGEAVIDMWFGLKGDQLFRHICLVRFTNRRLQL